MAHIPAQHPAICYIGRTALWPTGDVSFSFPAVSFTLHLEGTHLAAELSDDIGNNYIQVEIDGGEPHIIALQAGRHSYVLAENLSEGKHIIVVTKRSESLAGIVTVHYLTSNYGAELLPYQPPERKLEVIGDSITAGYGNEVSVMDASNSPFTTKNSNATKAYAYLAAKALGAQYLAVAYSGRGMHRNYDDIAGMLLPQMYDDVFPDDTASPRWDHKRYVADVTVINLGTNDFSTSGGNDHFYTEAYLAFIYRLRQINRNATLVLCLGSMLNDQNPPGEEALSRTRRNIERVVALRHHMGDHKVHFVEFDSQQAPFGEDFHPTAATHQAMAHTLEGALRRIMNW